MKRVEVSDWFDDPHVILSGGPDRVIYDDPDPEFVRRPTGFMTSATGVNAGRGDHSPARGADDAPDEAKGGSFPLANPAPVAEPLLWEGDQA